VVRAEKFPIAEGMVPTRPLAMRMLPKIEERKPKKKKKKFSNPKIKDFQGENEDPPRPFSTEGGRIWGFLGIWGRGFGEDLGDLGQDLGGRKGEMK